MKQYVKNAHTLASIFVLGAWGVSGHAQSPAPAFEVASIKASGVPVSEMWREAIRPLPGRLTMNNVTVAACLKWAYRVVDSQITGPDWIREERYTITAKSGGPASDDQMRAMVQTLLTDRFKVAFHRVPKTMAVYALVLSKGGPKLAATASEGAPEVRGRLKWTMRGYDMGDLAQFLSDSIFAPVVDMTGLSGRFDFAVDIASYFSIDKPMTKDEAAENLAVAFQSALQAQLGLKLESRKAPVDVLVVDHAEKPSEN
jgi:uncharacterized protein (TIGR03435 family)